MLDDSCRSGLPPALSGSAYPEFLVNNFDRIPICTLLDWSHRVCEPDTDHRVREVQDETVTRFGPERVAAIRKALTAS